MKNMNEHDHTTHI